MPKQKSVCKNCKQTFLHYNRHAIDSDNTFCTRICFNQYRSNIVNRKKHYCKCGREKHRKSKNCAYCAKSSFRKNKEERLDFETVRRIISESTSFVNAAEKLPIARGTVK